MSRLGRYKESLNRFIKDRSCLFDENKIPNAKVESIIYNKIKGSDLLLSIMLLTIMNNQNKKNSKSIQGYYAASSVQMLQILLDIVENKEAFIESHSLDCFNTIKEYLVLSSNYSLFQNLETVKDNFSGDVSSEVIINSLKIFNEKLSNTNILSTNCLEVSDNKPCTDLKNWYIREDKSLVNHFNKLKIVTKKSFKEYMEMKLGSICDITFQVGWLIGCGNPKDLKKIKKLSKSFGYLYKLAHDFDNLENDIRNTNNGISNNFIVNFGLQNSYEVFMENKQKFIEDAMILDLFTSTIKEILNFIEAKVDSVIEETSPDLKSNYSNVQSVGTFK